ncbi:hypothetical protein M9M90_12295 [Phenylobacterium sp. LH3H17]|uniref:hypothetical protein n=1 Tax=Phenylobacterium sp. LH3H17 TaxID=2903901 RepID=UPI0020C9B92E|nr:hypothetical protein [Phenylobacterium sp. LH3H17]UTP38015.1 hypothetical protein M9M90_12295 [Phenylobacterium sp. LH3H17]
MKTIIRAAALAAAIACGCAGIAQAQTAERVYAQGTVWSVGYIETKPGMFDEYMAYLNGPWKAIQEAGKKRGDVVSYKVLALTDTRDKEPDLVLMIEYKNMAVFDQSDDESDKQTSAVWGSPVKANQAAVTREAMRTTRGGFLAREMKFIK